MSSVLYDFAIIGGDLRQNYMAAMLDKRGYRVIAYGLDVQELTLPGDVKTASSLAEAIAAARIVIGPIPLSKDRITISCKVKKEDLTIEFLKKELMKKSENARILFAGSIPNELQEYSRLHQISYYDFMQNEELTVYNTIATAEGAIAEALIRHPSNLHGGNCLVLGYGRCAKTLAHKLAGLSASVTVCVRNPAARAQIMACGYQTLTFKELGTNISKFEYIFNTVPSLVLERELLECMNRKAIIIDIASKPGGLDYKAAGELEISAHLCLGLPGKYSPSSSAEALVNVILSEENKREKSRDNQRDCE